jgi:hypothetical protein
LSTVVTAYSDKGTSRSLTFKAMGIADSSSWYREREDHPVSFRAIGSDEHFR